MSALIRDAPIGQLIRLATGNRTLRYPEELPSFKLPESYNCPASRNKDISEKATSESPDNSPAGDKSVQLVNDSNNERPIGEVNDAPEAVEEPDALTEQQLDYDLEKTPTAVSLQNDLRRTATLRTGTERVMSRTALSNAATQDDLGVEFSVAAQAKEPSRLIHPVTLEDGTILVDFYDTDDQENPQNWSSGKKVFVAMQICLYTLAVYMGSAIYAPSEPGVMQKFGVSQQKAYLGLSMYVLAYGIGPLIWSPLSEIPNIGRNPPYMATFAIFVILCLPTALVKNFAGLIVLRFLQGFFGSPCLATGGASLGDLYSIIKLPYVLSIWALSATCGPALGPIISGFSVSAKTWRWSLWEMLWLAGPIWILMFVCLPETSTPNILLRRAKRLRKLTGDARLRSQSEIDQKNLDVRQIAIESLWRPVQLIVLDPSIAFTAVYVALVYGIFYSFFEAFPLVFIGQYGFTLGTMGLTFLSITVAVFISLAFYWSYQWFYVEPRIRTKGMGAPEQRLVPALFSAFLAPVGLFIFGWTSKSSIHWIVPLIGVSIFTIGVFIIFQCIFLYLPLSYPQYAASLFAGNDFFRSTLAACAIHFSTPLFKNLGIGKGISLLGGLTCGCIFGVFILYYYGANLRARSRFAAK